MHLEFNKNNGYNSLIFSITTTVTLIFILVFSIYF